MSTKRRGPGLKGKKSIWYFDKRGQPTMKKVKRLISRFISLRFEPFKKAPAVNIGIHNLNQITTRGLDEGLRDVIMLNPLDFYKILRWIRRGDLDFSRFKEQKIVFYNYPVIMSVTGVMMNDPGKFYICMQEDKVDDKWVVTILGEEFLRAQNYRIACLLKN